MWHHNANGGSVVSYSVRNDANERKPSAREPQAYDRRVILPAILDVRQRSLVRGAVMVAASLVVSLLLAGFPESRANPLLFLPLVAALAGTLDTARNMRRRWSWYHGGVLLLLYTDLMVLSLIVFLWLYPYAAWLSGTH